MQGGEGRVCEDEGVGWYVRVRSGVCESEKWGVWVERNGLW